MDHKKMLATKKIDQQLSNHQLILPIHQTVHAHRIIQLDCTRKWINDFDRKNDTVIGDTIVLDKSVPEQRFASILCIFFDLMRTSKEIRIFQSEERGKDDTNRERFLRPAGSSPCVVVEGGFNVRDQVADPEQGIYHGFYRLGTWICITDRDVWRRNDFPAQDGERHFQFQFFAVSKIYNCFYFHSHRTNQRSFRSTSVHRIGKRFS